MVTGQTPNQQGEGMEGSKSVLGRLSGFAPLGAKLLGGGAVLMGGMLLTAVALQERLLYVPVVPGVGRSYDEHPDKYGLAYEDVWLSADDGVKLHAWVMWDPRARQAAKAPAILFCQENAGNIALRLPNAAMMLRKLGAGRVMLLSYRGYGESEGKPSEDGLLRDASAALEHLRSRPDIDPGNIVLFGRSLGGAVTARLAAQQGGSVRAVVLENTFTSVPDLVPKVLPLLSPFVGPGRPLNALVRSQWRSKEAVPAIAVPTLFISAGKDELVPPEHMHSLFRLARKDVRDWLELPESGHMDAFAREEVTYWAGFKAFLESAGCYEGTTGIS